MAFTQAPADVDPRPGGAYKLFGGAVDASFVSLDPAAHAITLAWRFKDWPDGATSRVVIALDEPTEGTTVATVTQTGVPVVDRHGNGGVADTVEAGWRGQVLGGGCEGGRERWQNKAPQCFFLHKNIESSPRSRAPPKKYMNEKHTQRASLPPSLSLTPPPPWTRPTQR